MGAFCTSCGTARTASESFCLACGTQLAAAPAVAAPVAPAPATAPMTFLPTLPAASRSDRKLPVLIGGAAVVLALGAGGFFALHHGGSAKTESIKPAAHTAPVHSGPSAAEVARTKAAAAHAALLEQQRKDQARALASIVRASTTARSQVVSGVAKVQNCSDVSGGAALLAKAVVARSAILARLAAVDVSRLPNGKRMVAALELAQNDSLRADQAFRGWADDAYYSCYGSPTAFHDNAYLAGVRASADAKAAKQKFLTYWQPVAASTGAQSFTAEQI